MVRPPLTCSCSCEVSICSLRAVLAVSFLAYVVPIALGVLTAEQGCPNGEDLLDFAQCYPWGQVAAQG